METRDIYPSLSKEIIEEILLRLPVKSLLRFRCVSKEWQSLIDSKRFIRTHLQNSARNPSLAHHKVLLLKYVSSLPTLLQRSVLDSSDTHDALELEFPVDYIHIVGCCNGLVCLLLDRDRQRQFVLWNPSLRISKKLSQTDMMPFFHFYCCGFGWDESSGDYKVFAIAKRASGKSIYWIYSLKSDSWKESEEVKDWDSCKKEDRSRYGESEMGVFASGSLHWETTDRRGVVACDLKREALGAAMELPKCSECCRWQGIEVIGECLMVYYWCEDSSCLDIWMKKKESWEKVVVLDDHFFSPLYISPTLAPFWSGGFFFIKIGNLLVFDGKRFRDVVSLKYADVYIESLVSPLEL
ncbi:F-box/kelch-repeat protein At3g23880-like [Salvia miltiorrhiza]|uniref:F-box/kelch-repeat protein At3g23880-like n=1 Tax=Salvia miltiorrhiza TaxID=226208 RepID=UPI0025ACBF0B|nr:F-box/kelch-repeat protein At3g23880-like [Salvia miltiorrhiza]